MKRLAFIALWLVGCNLKTGFVLEVSTHQLSSKTAGVATLELIMAQQSQCGRWVEDQSASRTTVDVHARELSTDPYQFLVEPVQATDIKAQVVPMVLARDASGQLLGEAPFGPRNWSLNHIDKYRHSIQLLTRGAQPTGPRYVSDDGCVCLPGQPWIGTGSQTGCDPNVVTSFARLQDTKGCELPPGAPLPVACDGQQYPNETTARTLPCFAVENGACRVDARTCQDDGGVAYTTECVPNPSAAPLADSTLCDAYLICERNPCGDIIGCLTQALPVEPHSCTLRIALSTDGKMGAVRRRRLVGDAVVVERRLPGGDPRRHRAAAVHARLSQLRPEGRAADRHLSAHLRRRQHRRHQLRRRPLHARPLRHRRRSPAASAHRRANRLRGRGAVVDLPVTVRGGELLIVGFEGTSAPVDLLARIAERRVGGVCLFVRNLGTLDEILELNRALAAAVPDGDPPLLISLDQEGGRVQRIKAPFPHWPPMARLALAVTDGGGDVALLAGEVGRAMGDEVAALGFNVDWAPVLDVCSNKQNPIIGDRAFGSDAATAARLALGFWRGLESAGVRGCGKHYPGHGDTSTDSHLTLPVVARSLAELRAVELEPFAQAAKAGVPMLMTAHVVYPAVDDRPATLSHRWLSDILRGELGFAGVVVSDDLDMKAVAERFAVEQTVVDSLMAGCDCFLAWRDAAVQQKAEVALQKAATDAAVRARLEESGARLRSLRATMSAVPAAGAWRRLDLDGHRALAARLSSLPSK